MKILYIDTSNNKKTVVGLKMDGKDAILEKESANWKSQAVLPMVMEVLCTHSLQLTDIDAIEVVLGPGSFTGLRVGVSIANALATWLNIPVNGQPLGEIVEPIYQ
jgi:tRNA threonylcarbamoyladenosine biosynthesis protein TsaB